MNMDPDPFYIFAYGSLIWRPGFSYIDMQPAVVHGYARRFWQASHDHRGTPEKPGRDVTLMTMPGARCEGVVFRLHKENRQHTLAALDKREQDGYQRIWLSASIRNTESMVSVLSWLAPQNNPSWAGETALDELAQLILSRHGPSGSNRDYVLQLHAGLQSLDIEDEHVSALVSHL
jgi:cation transport protein ChaC